MNYEKILKDALNSKATPFEVSSWIEEQFPELIESKDEEIRKALTNVFATHKDYEMFFGVSVEDIRALLEKQGSKDKFIEKELGCIKGYREKAIKRLEELEKQDEQKASYTTIVETGNGGINALVTKELPTDGEQKPADKVGPIVVRDFNSVFSREQVEKIDKRIEESQRLYNAKLRDAMRKAEDFSMTD